MPPCWNRKLFCFGIGGTVLGNLHRFFAALHGGAAELEPPASGRIALFSTAIEFDVFSSSWPEVAAGEVVQLVSGFCPVAAGCAMAAPVSEAARTAAAIRSSTQTSGESELVFSRSAGLNVAMQRWFRRCACPATIRSSPRPQPAGSDKLRRHPIFDA